MPVPDVPAPVAGAPRSAPAAGRTAAGPSVPAAADPGFVAGGLPGRDDATADRGFVAGGRPGGDPAARRPVFGSAGYPGRASGKHSVRVAARADS
ncbi:hypothetical protein AB8A24_04310, partial [Streptomyces sp. BF23-19]